MSKCYHIKRAAAGTLAAVITAVSAVTTVCAAAPEDQTVYVITDATGAVTKVIGSESEEAAKLPVDIRVSYELDGEESAPEELAGKSGHVIIRLEYDNHAAAPFAVMTGLLLDDSVFSNVEISGGKLLEEGGRMMAVGLVFPGLQDMLDPDDSLFSGENVLDIPEELAIEADVTDFKLDIAYSIVLSGLLGGFDDSKLDPLEELTDSADQLRTAMGDILAGAQELSDGVGTLREGLSEIVSHNTELTEGAEQVFDALLSTVQEQIEAAGQKIAPLTIDNYGDVLDSLMDVDIEEQAREQVEAQIDAMGDALYTTYLEGQQEDILAAYLQEQAGDICKTYILSQIPEEQAALLPEAQLEAAVSMQMMALSEEEKGQILEGARQQLTDEQIAQILEGAAATLTQEQKELIREGAVEQGMESEEVQTLIEEAKMQAASLQSAKEQLDSYMEFYKGIVSYTEGVQSATEGAGELETGAEALKEGLTQFDEEGVETITDAVENKLQVLLDHVRTIIQQDRDYHYEETSDGSVKFIYKMGSVEKTSE